MNPTLRFDDSPPGAWRAARDRSATCAGCRQSTCHHSDLQYAGLAPDVSLAWRSSVRLLPAGVDSAPAPAGLSPSPTAPLPEAAPVPPVHEAGNG